MVIKIAPTNACNLNCRSCYNGNYRDKTELDFNTITEMVKEAFALGCTRIDLLGGEPTCYSKFDDLCKWCKNNNIPVAITTNATLINKETIDLFKCFEQMTISLDGFTAEENDKVRGIGTFNKVCSAIELINETIPDAEVYINCTLCKTGLSSLIESAELFRYECIKGINIAFPFPIGNATLQAAEFWPSPQYYFEQVYDFCAKYPDIVKKYNYSFYGSPLSSWFLDEAFSLNRYAPLHDYCMGGSFVYYIDAHGDVYPCNLEFGIEGIKTIAKEKGLQIGNINSSPLGDIIENKVYNCFFQTIRSFNRNYIPDEGKYCTQCPFFRHGFCAVKCPFSPEKRNTEEICEYLLDKYGTGLLTRAEAFARKYDDE